MNKLLKNVDNMNELLLYHELPTVPQTERTRVNKSKNKCSKTYSIIIKKNSKTCHCCYRYRALQYQVDNKGILSDDTLTFTVTDNGTFLIAL